MINPVKSFLTHESRMFLDWNGDWNGLSDSYHFTHCTQFPLQVCYSKLILTCKLTYCGRQ